ncbi:MAG: hypothetical protein BGP09_26995 [Rhizobium sp. 60-20]|nr:MAG: hypothetical protein BGP09_26995 [Rhizobium sp. 60-20]RKD61585.1 hypothetical protein BJ928_107186 [Rhizobium sp. WW_1]
MVGIVKRIFVFGLVLALSAWGCLADSIPAFRRKTMTNDPSTNWYLSEAMKPMPDADAEILRIYKLGGIIGTMCDGAKVNTAVGNRFLKTSGYGKLTGDKYKQAAFLADDRFKLFDYRALAHLCAGGDYMFGSQGHLLPNLITGNRGTPKVSYDPSNPYIMLPSISTAPHW